MPIIVPQKMIRESPRIATNIYGIRIYHTQSRQEAQVVRVFAALPPGVRLCPFNAPEPFHCAQIRESRFSAKLAQRLMQASASSDWASP
ncbi:MAG TPA: hypothetical protein VFF59_04370, partial [Anaerolineae bacterium]|nr:hypothetical protein [Anaerolineae bacterium]